MTTHTRQPADIHTAFGLSYSNYLVLPRTLLQSMPAEWQHQFTALLDQYNDAFAHVDQAETYIVTPANECTYSDLTDDELKALGITYTYGTDQIVDIYYHDGNEREPHDRVLAPRPGGDPVPHYNRGRTHIEPLADRSE